MKTDSLCECSDHQEGCNAQAPNVTVSYGFPHGPAKETLTLQVIAGGNSDYVRMGPALSLSSASWRQSSFKSINKRNYPKEALRLKL